MTRRAAPLAVAVALVCATALAAPPELGGPLPPPFPLFPPDNWWNADVSGAPVDPDSAAFIDFIGGDVLHPDFGGEVCPGCVGTYGLPYIVVDAGQPRRTVRFLYDDESDHIGYPIPDEAITEPHWVEHGEPGNQHVPDVDRHILVVDKENRHLYELYNALWDGEGWTAHSGAFFDMKTNDRRPEGWTSADAAGLAVLPGLVRYEEVYGPGEIEHAFRVTVRLSNGHVYPASHAAGDYPGALPMGARLRLKADKDVSASPPEVQKVFRAMKKYGLIVADNGADMFVQGTFDTRWDNELLNPAFAALTADDFEVIELGWKHGPYLSVTSPRGGERWIVGSSQEITWASEKLAPDATAEISLTDGAATTPVASVPASDGRCAWTVPSTPGSAWRVRVDAVSAGAVRATDASDLPFAILTTVSVSDATVTEGDSGTTVTVPVSLAVAVDGPVTVEYFASNGTADAGADFDAVSGALTFAPGETSKAVDVGIVADTLKEPTEAFSLVLHSPVGAEILRGEGTVTILDDDPEPVAWTALVRVLAEGGSLRKTAPDGWGNSGAVSVQQIVSGDGYVEFTAAETDTTRVLGLSTGNDGARYQDVDYAIALYGAEAPTVGVFENGARRGVFGPYAEGDTFRVALVSGVVEYSRNGEVFHRSARPPSYPLLVDTALHTRGATLVGALIFGATASPPPVGPPFGALDDPPSGTTGLTGAVAVTGWALDEASVASVAIYRDPVAGETVPPEGRIRRGRRTGEPARAAGKIHVGDAAFVPGSRPDLAAHYPAYPDAGDAGWDYTLLTPALPNGGSGTYTLFAYATDTSGAIALLGSATITCSNAAPSGGRRPARSRAPTRRTARP
jgi:hypothetical protein